MAKNSYSVEKIANNMTSSMLIHPGEMIKDEIVARGLTQKDLAQQMVSQSSCDFRIKNPLSLT